jgi:hypothetical protein
MDAEIEKSNLTGRVRVQLYISACGGLTVLGM